MGGNVVNGLSDIVGHDEIWVGVRLRKGDGIEDVSESGDQRRLTQCQSLTVTCWVSRGHGVSEDYMPRERMRLPYSRSSMNPLGCWFAPAAQGRGRFDSTTGQTSRSADVGRILAGRLGSLRAFHDRWHR